MVQYSFQKTLVTQGSILGPLLFLFYYILLTLCLIKLQHKQQNDAFKLYIFIQFHNSIFLFYVNFIASSGRTCQFIVDISVIVENDSVRGVAKITTKIAGENEKWCKVISLTLNRSGIRTLYRSKPSLTYVIRFLGDLY